MTPTQEAVLVAARNTWRASLSPDMSGLFRGIADLLDAVSADVQAEEIELRKGRTP